jgi:hypothetical protein
MIALQWSAPDEPIMSVTPPLPAHIAEFATLTNPRSIDPLSFRSPTAEELPEIAELTGQGWALLAWDQRMIWPIWPATHRGWMPDRVPRFAEHHHLDGSASIKPLTRLQERHLREDEADWWRPLDLPAPPSNRLWFVRSPWPTHTVSDLWGLLGRRATQLSPADPIVALPTAASELITSEGSVLTAWRDLPAVQLRAERPSDG